MYSNWRKLYPARLIAYRAVFLDYITYDLQLCNINSNLDRQTKRRTHGRTKNIFLNFLLPILVVSIYPGKKLGLTTRTNYFTRFYDFQCVDVTSNCNWFKFQSWKLSNFNIISLLLCQTKRPFARSLKEILC